MDQAAFERRREASRITGRPRCPTASGARVDSRLLEVVTRSRRARFDLFLDVTAVDWPQREPRFDVCGTSTRRATSCASGEDPCRSRIRRGHAHHAVRSARYMERECHDMYGIGSAATTTCGRSCSTRIGATAAQTTQAREQRWCLPDAGVSLPHSTLRTRFGRPSPRAAEGSVIVNSALAPATHGTIQSWRAAASACCAPTCTAATCPGLREGVRVAHLAQPDPLRRPLNYCSR